MATDPRIYLVLGILIKETDKAMLISVHEVEGETQDTITNHWFPKTQIVDSKFSDDPEDLDRFNIKHWIMSERGLV